MVSPPDPPVLENMVFLGWSETMQEEPLAEVSEKMEWFDFTVAVSAAAADGGNILKLYAWYGDSLEMNELVSYTHLRMCRPESCVWCWEPFWY